jgi:hypothetical protein
VGPTTDYGVEAFVDGIWADRPAQNLVVGPDGTVWIGFWYLNRVIRGLDTKKDGPAGDTDRVAGPVTSSVSASGTSVLRVALELRASQSECAGPDPERPAEH